MDKLIPKHGGYRNLKSFQIAREEVAANGVLALLAAACSLLDRQLVVQVESCTKEGGFTERLYRTRTTHRK